MDDAEVRKEFDQCDGDSNGLIDQAEFAKLMQTMHPDMDGAQTKRAFQIIDVDENGLIDFSEFHAWWTS